MEKKYNSEKEFLKEYDVTKYEKPSLTVDMLIYTIDNKKADNYRLLTDKSLQVLMVKRKDYPFKDFWAIPGGFIDMHESLLESAQRKLNEKTGLKDVYMEQLYSWGDLERDPRTRVVSISYMALINKDEVKKDIVDGKWFDISYKLDTTIKTEKGEDLNYILTLKSEDEVLTARIRESKTIKKNLVSIKYDILESDNIAFDHAKILAYSIRRLKTKAEWSDIVFHLMPEKFTLGDLQNAYSVILGKKLIPANFRRKIKPMIIPLDEQESKTAGHRPSMLFKFNPNWMEAI